MTARTARRRRTVAVLVLVLVLVLFRVRHPARTARGGPTWRGPR